MSDYKPREHDKLVEPLFGGLAGHAPARVERAWGLWCFVALCALIVAARVWALA
jgi:hypothetical protein